MKKKILLLGFAMLSLFITSCGGSTDNPGGNTDNPGGNTDNPGGNTENKKLDFNNVTFEDLSFVYDGKSHILNEVTGAPENTSIVYKGRNEYKDVGTYKATAALSKEGYNDKVLEATLTITPATFSGYTFESKTVKYDGLDHINDIQLVGILPEGTTYDVTVKDESGEIVSSAVDVGEYSYTCVVTNKNYTEISLTATLIIKAQKKNMPVFITSDGTTYFANGLHNDYLYSLSGGSLALEDYSYPTEFNKYGSTSATFISGSTILSTIKEVSTSGVSTLYTDSNIDDFAKYSDKIYYYSSNSLRASKSGIYRVDASDAEKEPVVTKVFEGKTDNLAIYNNDLYFTNGNNKNYLYKINLNTNESSIVLENKVHEYVINNNKLYCTINDLINDYIGYIDLSNSDKEVKKLTNAAGEFLTIRDGYLYYNYTDLYSSIEESVKGVYRIKISGGKAEQILKNSGVNGFDVESNGNVIYIDTSNLHLYRYDASSKTSTDLLKDFVAPESTPLNIGGETISVGTKTYYLNMYAGKTLYVYDESSKKTTQLTDNKVQDFYIYNDILYFNQVTLFTNNDLYAVNIRNGGVAEKITSNDTRNLVSDGTYLYGTHYNFAGVSGGLFRMKLDGSEYIKFSEINGAKNFEIKDNKLYYINSGTAQDNGNIEYISLKDIKTTSEKLEGTNLSKNIKNAKQFSFEGDDLYYIYNGTIDNSIRRVSLSNLNDEVKIASSKTNPSEFILNGDYVYYYSFAASATSYAGFYKVKKNATKDGTQELLVKYDSKYYGTALSISDSGYMYFLNYIPKLLLGDAHFYQIDLNSKDVLKIS